MKEASFLWDLLNRLQPEERIFKLNDATLSPDGTIVVTLLVRAKDYDNLLDENLPTEETPLRGKVYSAVRAIIAEAAGKDLPVFVKYRKTVTDNSQINKEIFSFINEKAKLLAPKIAPSDVVIEFKDREYISVKIGVSDSVEHFCVDNKVGYELKSWLDRLFMEDAEIEFDITKKEAIIPIGEYQQAPLRTVEYQNPVKLYGNITLNARYISDILDMKTDVAKVCITGKVSAFKARSKKADPNSKFYLFRLDDTSGIIDIKFFPRGDAQIGAIETVEDGQYLVVEGPLRYDTYSEGFAITAYSFSRIEVDYKALADSVKYLPCPKAYFMVNPQPYVEEESYNVSIYDKNNEDVVPKFLKGKTFVIFDTETTGKTMNEDEPIEIAAVRMVDGKFTETFTTLIKPVKKTISAEITGITHIDNEMVADAPTFSQIAGDIKLFFGDAILVAYNSPFDIGMVTPQMRKHGYDLDNEVIDAFQLALQYVKSTKYNLAAVCEALDISLEGAHRSLNDTIATAKLFRKLACKLK